MRKELIEKSWVLSNQLLDSIRDLYSDCGDVEKLLIYELITPAADLRNKLAMINTVVK